MDIPVDGSMTETKSDNTADETIHVQPLETTVLLEDIQSSKDGDINATNVEEPVEDNCNDDPNKEDEIEAEEPEVDNISIDPDDFESEEEEAENKNLTKAEKLEKLIERLGYSSMTMQIFHKMRETFGHEECEFCGKLFYNKVDFDNHMRTHTG